MDLDLNQIKDTYRWVFNRKKIVLLSKSCHFISFYVVINLVGNICFHDINLQLILNYQKKEFYLKYVAVKKYNLNYRIFLLGLIDLKMSIIKFKLDDYLKIIMIFLLSVKCFSVLFSRVNIFENRFIDNPFSVIRNNLQKKRSYFCL